MSAIEGDVMVAQQPVRPWNWESLTQALPALLSPRADDQPLASFLAGMPEAKQRLIERALFAAQWFVISVVSTIDTYLTIRFEDYLYYGELNPIARLLLWLENWDPALLVGAKFLGSILVLAFLIVLYFQNRRVGLIVSGALAGFQLALLGFLALA